MELIDVPVPAIFRTRRGAPLSFGIVKTKVRRVDKSAAPMAVRSGFPLEQWHRAWDGRLWDLRVGGLRLALPADVERRGAMEWLAIDKDLHRSHWIGMHPFQHVEPDPGLSLRNALMGGFREDASEFAAFREVADAVRARADEALVVGDELWMASLGPMLSVEIGSMMRPERVSMTADVEGSERHVLPSERRYSTFDMDDLEHVYRGQGLEVLRNTRMPEVKERTDLSIEDVSRRAFAAELGMAAWGALQDAKAMRPSEIDPGAVAGLLQLRDGIEQLRLSGTIRPVRWGAKAIRVSPYVDLDDVAGLVDPLRTVVDGTPIMLPAYRVGWQAFLEEADRRLGRSVDAKLLGATF